MLRRQILQVNLNRLADRACGQMLIQQQALFRGQFHDAYLMGETKYDRNPTDENTIVLIDLLIRLIDEGDVPEEMLDAEFQGVQETIREIKKKIEQTDDDAIREQFVLSLRIEQLELYIGLTDRALLLLDVQTERGGDRRGLLGPERTKLLFLCDELTEAKNSLFEQVAGA